MNAPEILRNLKRIFAEISNLSTSGHTNNLANETRVLANNAIYYIVRYPSSRGNKLSKIRIRTLVMLNRSIEKADLYYSSAAGYDAENRKNDKVQDFEFINPAYGALDYFINAVEG